jgi:2-polyprenyl-3-methyl-5-hydroxy-6-metoxy-1,4-benzoquinol methylase
MANNKIFWKKYYKVRYYHSITPEQTRSEINFLRRYLPQLKYSNILDFICGFGRHSIALAKLDYNIEGFDIDTESIREAKKIITKYKLKNIKLYPKDALKFNKVGFDAAICLYSSIGFLDEKSNKKVFKNLFKSVKKGGRIILDVMNPEWAIKNLIPYMEKRIKYLNKTYLIKHYRKIIKKPIREINSIEFINKEKISIDKISYTLRLFSQKELENIFSRNNIKIIDCFGTFKMGAVSEDHQRIIIVADKT